MSEAEVKLRGSFAERAEAIYARLLTLSWRRTGALTPRGERLLAYLRLRLQRRWAGAGRWG